MTRSIALSVLVCGLAFAAGYIALQQVVGDAKPQQKLQPIPPAEKNAPPNKKEDAKHEPVEEIPPYFIKRWKMPPGVQEPDSKAGIELAIDPNGPKLLTRTKGGTQSWNPATGETGPAQWIEPRTTLRNGKTPQDRWAIDVFDRNSGQKLLQLPEAPTRCACYTPDACRLIVVGYPSTYSARDYIQIPSGVTIHKPAEFFKNLQLFNIYNGEKLGAIALKDSGLDDHIWAVAVVPDGKSFYVATKEDFLHMGFQSVFGVRPLTLHEKK